MSSNRSIKRDEKGLSGEDYRKIGTGEKPVPKVKRTTSTGYMPSSKIDITKPAEKKNNIAIGKSVVRKAKSLDKQGKLNK